jgi:hypothetical protein
MTEHLSSERIAALVLEERSSEEALHLDSCARCREEVERLRETFALFRQSGERWSEHWYGKPAEKAFRRSNWRLAAAGAMGASILAGALSLYTPAPALRAEAPFLPIPYTVPLAPYERTSVMRMDVPVAALTAAGFEVHGHEPGSTIPADVLVGQDGRARAFRLISNGSFLK